VTRDDAGRVIPLSERFNPQSQDIRYSLKPGPEEGKGEAGVKAQGAKAKAVVKDTIASAVEIVANTLSGKPAYPGARPELARWKRIFQTIANYADDVPALRVMFDAAVESVTRKSEFTSWLLNSAGDFAQDKDIEAFNAGKKDTAAAAWLAERNKTDEKDSDLTALRKFKKASKMAYKTFSDYIFRRDLNRFGGRVEVEILRDAGGAVTATNYTAYTPGIGKKLGTFQTENEAWMTVFEHEFQRVQEKHGKAVALAVWRFRMINHRAHMLLMSSMDTVKQELDRVGEPHPKVWASENGKNVKVDIFEALRRIGDLRGSYMPRRRSSGGWKVVATKEGTAGRLELFTGQVFAKKRMRELEREGYTVKLDRSGRPSEEAFGAASLVATQDIINAALDKAKHDITGKKTLEDFGYTMEVRPEKRKDGTSETDFVISGERKRKHNTVFKAFGGRYYARKKGGEKAWHFVNAPSNIDQRISDALEQDEGSFDRTATLVFANAFVEQVADIIHSRGSRASKIGRSEATGQDVFQGYETDSLLAVAGSVASIAGGSAKSELLNKMIRAMTGTTVSWQDFTAEVDMKSLDMKERQELWKAYQDFVKEQRIDSATQPTAYKEADSYLREAFRNDSDMDRIMGAIRGIASLKYLASFSSPIVNLTAMITSVPAILHAAGVPFLKIPGLIAKNFSAYTRYIAHYEFGRGLGLPKDSEAHWIMQRIVAEGWDAAQFNREAVSMLQSMAGRTVSNITDKALIMFQWTERVNRATTIAAAYEGIRRANPSLSQEDALKKAKKVSDDAHGVYGKAATHAMGRGDTAGAHVIRSFTMFKTFPLNYFWQMVKLSANKDSRDIKAALYMLISPIVIGGLGAIPLWSPLVTALKSLIRWILPGDDDPEEDFYQWVGDEFGGGAERTMRHGLAGGVAGVNLRGSLQMDLQSPFEWGDGQGGPKMDVLKALGPIGGLVSDVAIAGRDIAHGDFLRAGENMAPRLVASPLRAIREAKEGVTTRAGTPVFWGDEQLQPTVTDTVRRALGFNPSDISEKRDQQWSERETQMRFQNRQRAIYDRVRAWARKDGDAEEWAAISREIEAYNRMVERSRVPGLPDITKRGLDSVTRRATSPNTTEKSRAKEEGGDEESVEDLTDYMPDLEE